MTSNQNTTMAEAGPAAQPPLDREGQNHSNYGYRSKALQFRLEDALEALRAARDTLRRSRNPYTRQQIDCAIQRSEDMLAEIDAVDRRLDSERKARQTEIDRDRVARGLRPIFDRSVA